MPEMSLLIMVVLLALTFDFINGFHDNGERHRDARGA